MVVTATYLLPRYLKGGLTTIPGFLAKRFDVSTKTITSALFLTGYVVVLLPVILYSGSLALSGMFDVPGMLGVSENAAIWICVWGIGLIGMVYAVFGGLKAVAVSDSINAIGLLIGGVMIPVFGLIALGDGSMWAGLDIVANGPGERLNALGGPTASVPFATIFTGMMLVQLFYWGTNQQIIQRALGAKDLAEGQKGLLLAAGVKILGPILLVLPGMIAWHMFDGSLEVADQAYPKLVKEVLPAPLVGFFAAVLFGAILSSFNSVLNSSVTLYGIDIYKQHINPDADEKTVVKNGKIFGLILAFAAMFLAPLIAGAGSIFAYLQEVNGIYSIPILTIIVIGYTTKFVPAIAAKIGVISGSVLYIISQFYLKFRMIDSALESAKASGVTDEAALKLVEANAYPHFLHMMAILFVLNIVIMLIIGKFNPRSTPYELEYTEQVDITPWKYVKQASIAVCVIVVGIYIYFS
jgi:SSS family solute:Na+ symporter